MVVLATALFTLLIRAKRPAKQLPNGQTMQIIRWDYGRSSRVCAGTLRQRLLGRLLPTKLCRQFGIPVFELNTTNDVLFAWAEISRRDRIGSRWPVLAVADEDGLLGPPATPSMTIPLPSSGKSTNAHTLLGYRIDNFPRGSRHLGVCVFQLERDGWNEIAKFKMRNPSAEIPNTWPAEAMAVTRTNGSVTFVLSRAETGLAAAGALPLNAPMWSKIAFRLQTTNRNDDFSGHDPSGWIIKGIDCWDGAGNHISGSKMQDVGTNDSAMLIAGTLWPNRTWKIRAQFEPITVAAEKFPDETKIKFDQLAIPPVGVTNQLQSGTQLLNSVVTLKEIGSAQTNWTTNKAPFLQLRHPVTVKAQFTPSVSARELRFVKAIDNNGRPANRLASAPDRFPTEFRLLVNTNASAINLVLAVLPTYTVDYYVRPTVTRTNFVVRMKLAE